MSDEYLASVIARLRIRSAVRNKLPQTAVPGPVKIEGAPISAPDCGRRRPQLNAASAAESSGLMA